MILAQILSPWTGDGGEPGNRATRQANRSYRPRLLDDYPLLAHRDASRQPAANLLPDPNLAVVEALLSELTLAQIEMNSAYLVLWSEPV